MTELFERISRLSPQRLALLVLDLQSKLDAVQRARQEPIAIIGMSCRTPGGVTSPEGFWDLLVNGVDAITEVPEDRWKLDIPELLGRRSSGDLRGHWGGFIEGVDQFDAQFFGIVPREAVRMDPQQRILLEVAWEALERTGIAPDRLEGSQTGVFIGQNSADYGQVLLSAGLNAYDLHSLMGGMPCITAGRISYLLGLNGPNLALDTGCSSSLVALHLAVQSLRAGECNLALAGGVNAILTPGYTVAASRAEVLAPDGRCKTFDAAANGYVRSDGCGVVVLKRLSDAQADGDTILAIIRGTAANQDGRSNGLTAPNGPSQTEAIRAALASGGVDPLDVTYVEAHGTGTPLGDPIEAQALGVALGEGRSADQPLWIGSVKTNIGHLEAAAGVAGLIKLVLSLQHGQIPPSLNFTNPSPHIPWDTMPLRVPTTALPWDTGDRPRIGGVSSFGLSGTNAHAVVEAAPASEPKANDRERPLHLLPISAKTGAALDDLARRYRSHLASKPAAATADMAYTAGVGRSQFPHRLALIGSSPEELEAGLATYLSGATSPTVLRSRSVATQAPKVAFLFTGLGSQFVGMGRQLYETQPTFRAALEECQEILRPILEQPLLSVLYPEDGVTSQLEDRAYGLPVVFAFEYALTRLWRSWGIEPSFVLGHSLGEYVAACVAGIFSLEDGLRLSAERARLVSTLPSAGQMVSVLATEAQVAEIIADFPNEVSFAAINGPESVVVAGASDAMQQVLERCRAAGFSVRTLAIPFAAHSPMLEPILDPFEQFAASIRYSSPRLDLVSGRTGRLAGEHELTNATYWRRHLREPVRFADAVETLYAEGCRLFIEVGSAPVLLGLGQQSILDPETAWLPTLDPKRPDWDRLLESLGTLFTRGVDVDWAGFDRDYSRQKVILPTYPFQRERFWIDVAAEAPRATTRALEPGLHPLLGSRVRSPLAETHQFEALLSAQRPAFLADHRILGQASLPAAGYVESALTAATEVYGSGAFEIEQLSFRKALFLPDQDERAVQVVLTPGEAQRADLRVYSAGEQQEPWLLHATGAIRRVSQAGEASSTGLSLDAVQARCSEDVASATVYERLAAAGIEFGPRFQGLTRLWRGSGEALGQIDAPDSVAGELSSYAFHPAMLDACFHALEAALPDERPPLTYLTIGLDRVRVLGAPTRRLWSHVILRDNGSASGESFVCDLDVYDDQARLVVHIEGVLLQGTSREALLGDGQSLTDALYDVQWRAQPRSDVEDVASVADSDWLILTDQDGIGDQLAAEVARQGGRVSRVRPGARFAQVSDDVWQVDPSSERDFEQLLDDVSGSSGEALRIVHLWGLRSDSGRGLDAAALDDAQALTVASALHLTQALAARSADAEARLWLVTRDVHPVGSSEAAGVAQAPLWGLGRVIAVEQPDIWGGLIDLGPTPDLSGQAASLLAEILNAGEDQVALRDVDRYVARLAPTSAPPEASATLSRDGAYLIVGGLGGLGLAVARALAEQGAGHLVLLGRRGLPAREHWSDVPTDSATGGQIAAVRAIEALGAKVTAVSADNSDAVRMQDVLALFGTELPPLRGVIHSAAALDDSILTQSSWPRFRQAMRAKVDGAWVLHELTRELPLDFFVMFSSVASLMASPGLGNYAASNAFLDALAHYRRQQGLPGLTVNWGVWDGIGISAMAGVGERVAERTSTGGLNLIPVDDGLAMLQRLIVSDATQVLVSRVQWNTFLQQFPQDEAPAFYDELARPTQPLRDITQTMASHGTLLDRVQAASAEERELCLALGLREILAEVAELGPPDELPFDLPLQQFGVDSLVAVQLRNRITTEIGLTVPISSLIGGSSLAELATALLDRLAPGDGGVKQQATEAARVKESVDWTSHVAELSEEDLDLLLMEMLASEKGDS